MLSTEEITALTATHKRIAHVIGKDNAWEVVLRKPTRAEYKRYRGLIHGDGKAEASEWLARATCVYPPSPDAFDALLEDYPAIPEACGSKLGELLGLATEQAAKT